MKVKPHTPFKLMQALLLMGTLSLLASNAFASTGTATVSSNVPLYCEIMQVDPTHADFSPGSVSMSTQGMIHVQCNLDVGYSLSSPTPNASGRFNLDGISGVSEAKMPVLMREPTTGSIWTNNGYYVGGQGTGRRQFVNYEIVYNPDGGIPPYGTFSKEVDFVLQTNGYGADGGGN